MPGPSRSSAPIAGTPSSPVSSSSLLSVGSIVMHDSIRCDILRSPIVHLGSKSLSTNQPTFAMSRLTLQLRFIKLDDESRIHSRSETTGSASTTAVLEYVDARIHLSDSMSAPEGEGFLEPLQLADALAGDQHYERIIRGGNALCTDLKTANLNREDNPKPRATGGFIVKEGGAPVVGMLGAQWIDTPVDDGSNSAKNRRTGKHGRTESNITSASAPLEPIHEHSVTCTASHWTGEPSGSGTGDIIFQLSPATKCNSCSTRPLQMVHLASKKSATARTPTALSAKNLSLLPNKAFRLVAHLLSMDSESAQPEEFFAHVRIVFYFTDDRGSSGIDGQDKACCQLKRHTFTASIKIGKEGDHKVKQKKETDFNDALARLEGKVKSTATPQSRPHGRRLVTT